MPSAPRLDFTSFRARPGGGAPGGGPSPHRPGRFPPRVGRVNPSSTVVRSSSPPGSGARRLRLAIRTFSDCRTRATTPRPSRSNATTGARSPHLLLHRLAETASCSTFLVRALRQLALSYVAAKTDMRSNASAHVIQRHPTLQHLNRHALARPTSQQQMLVPM